VHGGDNGYTHHNQIIGAGVGFGADLQTIQVEYKYSHKQHSILFQAERILRDPQKSSNQWTDFSFMLKPVWQLKRVRISTEVNCIFSNNFIWKKNYAVINFMGKLVAIIPFNINEK
jgi:hypothetical protein